ncbi:MAG: glycoside hydrolase [Candidatus Pacebacteria bacterium]|nr:glycoside hydrolase [Candidatus Paceibacterota bacterium]
MTSISKTVDTKTYLNPPAVIPNPGSEYGAETRAFQGISSLACGKQERLWAVWYGGITPGEDHNNYVILALSTDNGHTWSDEKLVIDPDGEGPVRAFDPEVWMAPDGKLWVFWAQHDSRDRFGTLSGVWAVTASEDDGADAQWSEPRRLCDGVMMCKPIVLSTGEWALPVSFWHRREAGSAGMVVSDDGGTIWTERGACDVPPNVRDHDEHMIVERRDGTLWTLVRTRYGIGESTSSDGGTTWTPLTPSKIPHACSRFFVRRLASGRLLLVRHDPADGNFANETSRGTRSHLAAFLSDDDGHTWPYRLLLDERAGVSYPDGDEAADGTIYITYDYNRYHEKEILMAAFGEQDVERGSTDAESVRLRVLINQASGETTEG